MTADTKAFDIPAFLKTLPGRPGVYRMLDTEGVIIYVGKARNLKRRVSSYFQRQDNSPKTRAMVSHVHSIEITVTYTEGEALLLENNLIKEHKPRYNILLRDDKSYPYLYISAAPYPRLDLHRGARKAKGRYFGPYPSVSAVRESLNLLQKLFQVRQCEDNFYRNRSRPCLQHQIDRCTAPCVGLISEEDYAEDVRHTGLFLEGRSSQVIDELVQRMEEASTALKFELAARYRDQIAALRRTQERQYVSSDSGDLDVIAVVSRGGLACVQQFFIRGGHNLGNKSYFPGNVADATDDEILAAFIAQYYLQGVGEGAEARGRVHELLVSTEPEDVELLQTALSEHLGRKLRIHHRLRGERERWLQMARENAEHALTARLANSANILARYDALQEALQMDERPARMECFDISHTMGEATVASCVVFDLNGPLKSDYRRFNIEDITPGDDYAAMKQALERRFKRLKRGEGKMPDILVIDGGKGQLSQAEEVLQELQVHDVLLLGVAKGPGRKPGLEQLYLSASGGAIILPPDSPALHLIQQIRDEAHRFAISGHRQRRSNSRKKSPLEAIPGLGPKRRQQLLKQFGGLQEIQRAGVEDLSRVQGISRELAGRIYDALHPEP